MGSGLDDQPWQLPLKVRPWQSEVEVEGPVLNGRDNKKENIKQRGKFISRSRFLMADSSER